MSPRAAWRLETLDFGPVYDYMPGKVDWLAAGLATEGTNAGTPRVGQRTRRDVPRCRLGERLGDAAARARDAGWRMTIVVNEHDIVFGVVEGEKLNGDPEVPVESAMRPGPSTYRAHVATSEMAQHLGEHNLHRAIITTPEGQLIGVAFVQDLQDSPPEQPAP